ncbi:nuclear transport factor 2 family protein [Marinobacterium sp. D7]|uniref:ketosteroid isomerase-related protein n=1 Tax=Marinobacterium ramblicola TaxID=2849041 RepID=UPI001C2D2F3B|nr:ketosteroid isomerase-related protein [Marinobacterium ramblicola]MBV1790226.1 nuclear transport factor 2 family protein [Marinobacterium ramblicola]
MSRAATEALIFEYYRTFNQGDMDSFLSLLSSDVVHDINQGERQIGVEAFAAFMDKMNRCYREQLAEIVIMSSPDGSRAAAEFVVHGEYIADDEGLPPAKGQTYRLPAGAFFEVRNGQIARISNYYNLNDWIAQVS